MPTKKARVMKPEFSTYEDTIIIFVEGGVVSAVKFNGVTKPDVVIVDHDDGEVDVHAEKVNQAYVKACKTWKELY